MRKKERREMRKIFLVLIAIAVIPVMGQSSEPNSVSQKGGIDMRLNENELALVYAVAKDCIDLLPDLIDPNIDPNTDPNLDSIIEGARDFNSPTKPITYSIDRNNLGWQAALVVRQVYSGKPPQDLQIPALVYYEAANDPNVIQRLKETKNKLADENKDDKSYYNAAINVLLDLWLENLRQSGQAVSVPAEGVYIRDDENHLYLYERAE
jgi:hypothetical protein